MRDPVTVVMARETRERLALLKVVPRESYDSVIVRLIVNARPREAV